jgi:hypothetical protein
MCIRLNKRTKPTSLDKKKFWDAPFQYMHKDFDSQEPIFSQSLLLVLHTRNSTSKSPEQLEIATRKKRVSERNKTF